MNNNDKKKEEEPLYTKMDILCIILVPFFIAVLFGDEFKVRTGEHYEAVRYVGLLLISSLAITYIKYTMTSHSIKRTKDVIDIIDKGADERAKLYQSYVDTLKEVQRLTKAVREKENK